MSEARPLPIFETACVTGATGFLGQHLCARLAANGTRVTALVRSTSQAARMNRLAEIAAIAHTGDALQASLDAARPGIVFHLAARYTAQHRAEDIAELISDNVELTARLCDAMISVGCDKLVAAGTAWQNATTPPGDNTPTPNTFYAATKQAADEFINYYARTSELNAITLKIYDSYGPGDPRRKFLNVLAESAARGETMHASPGDQQLHMVHVDDLIDGFVHAGNLLATDELSGRHGFTLPSPSARTLREIAAAWLEANGVSAEIEWGARPHRPGEVMTPWEGTPLPGWAPRIALEDGLRGYSV